jgi:hypothetical protein
MAAWAALEIKRKGSETPRTFDKKGGQISGAQGLGQILCGMLHAHPTSRCVSVGSVRKIRSFALANATNIGRHMNPCFFSSAHGSIDVAVTTRQMAKHGRLKEQMRSLLAFIKQEDVRPLRLLILPDHHWCDALFAPVPHQKFNRQSSHHTVENMPSGRS